MSLLAKLPESLLQTMRYRLRHPEMQGRRHQPRGITALGQIEAEPSIHEVGHALRWSRLLAIALLPTVVLQLFLKVHHF